MKTNKTKNVSSSAPISSAFIETVTERCGDHIIASTVRPATKSDIQAAKKLHARGKCRHNIVTDKSSWPYDIRSCFICGKGLRTV